MRALPYPSDRLARPYKADLRSGVSAGDRSLGARDDSSSPGQVSWLTDRRSPVPSRDKLSQWRTSGSLPAHSGATAPVSHRLPFSSPGGSRQGKPRVVADASAILVVSPPCRKCHPSPQDPVSSSHRGDARHIPATSQVFHRNPPALFGKLDAWNHR
jgi:hypothetical protein